MSDPYYGGGLSDANGNPLQAGDAVMFLGKRHVLRLKAWDDPSAGPVKRLKNAPGCYWLTPYSANHCERIAA